MRSGGRLEVREESTIVGLQGRHLGGYVMMTEGRVIGDFIYRGVCLCRDKVTGAAFATGANAVMESKRNVCF